MSERKPFDPNRKILAETLMAGMEELRKYPNVDDEWRARWLSGWLGSYAYHTEEHGRREAFTEAANALREYGDSLMSGHDAANDVEALLYAEADR